MAQKRKDCSQLSRPYPRYGEPFAVNLSVASSHYLSLLCTVLFEL